MSRGYPPHDEVALRLRRNSLGANAIHLLGANMAHLERPRQYLFAKTRRTVELRMSSASRVGCRAAATFTFARAVQRETPQ